VSAQGTEFAPGQEQRDSDRRTQNSDIPGRRAGRRHNEHSYAAYATNEIGLHCSV
jgi:hypothetical protein